MPPLPAPLSAPMRAQAADRVRGCLWGLLAADALAMPAHWYYDLRALRKDFGEIRGYVAPKEHHPGSIMSVSNTGGHGRGGTEGRIIGDVINHGKHHLWGKPAVHYHHGMPAGANTLNALCARVVVRGIVARNGTYSPDGFLEDYVAFMTTPGSHDDTYAESFHRDFFSNWARGVPPARCAAGTEGHNTASVGGLVMLPPVVAAAWAASGGDAAAAADAAAAHLALTHDSAKLSKYARVYAALLSELFSGGALRPAVLAAAEATGLDLPRVAALGYDDSAAVHSVFGSACYIDSAFPAALYLLYKHADSFEAAVLSNANAGGDNCHRGAALGAAAGAAAGASRIPRPLVEGLQDSSEIGREIDAFVRALGLEGGAEGSAACAGAAARA